MTHTLKPTGRLWAVLLLLAVAFALPWQRAEAAHDIRGIAQPAGGYQLYAYPFFLSLPEGTSLYMWGFGNLTGGGATPPEAGGDPYYLPQYPAPTLIVKEGDPVSIKMTNYGVPDPVSIVVAGHQVTALGGSEGLVTQSANVGETVTYTFKAGKPGTYVYHSMDGANPGLHQEMGLAGALIVRPADYDASNNRTVYGANTGTDYDQEFLYLLSEVDPEIHAEMERGHKAHFTYKERYATVWFVNGRVFPDLFGGDYNPLYPNQPYESLAQANPGDKVLVRAVNVGQDSHPFHFHGENLRFVGRDGRMLSSNGDKADIGRSDNTLNSAPKQTVDMLWTWTGKNLNWDIYGPVRAANECTDDGSVEGSVAHNMADDAAEADGELIMCHDDTLVDVVDNTTGVALSVGPCAPGDCFDDHNYEYVLDHGKDLPVSLPGTGDLTFGGWWSGSPFLGDAGDLPPGEGGLNPFGGYFLVWHSHAEKELTTFNIFPGGSLSSVVVLPPYVEIQ